ncbi:MAG TPA: metallophosphoesterase family protein [Burkholderiales bacterium]|nr:metallophosphoesterase family protein [Burkholderiales bacterium]
MKIAVAVLVAALLCGCASPGRFEFALIGDQQYDAESDAQFPRLMADIDRAEVEFVVHLGDFKPGVSLPCDDKLFESRRQQFNASRHPLIYTPGDNDWTDCHNPKAGGYVPEERLASLRRILFADRQSLGRRKLELEQQPDFPENLRWRRGNILFLTLHIVGSNNNLGRTPEGDAEYGNRMAANVAWIRDAFALAKRDNAAAVAIFTQANPRFERSFPGGRVTALGVGPVPKAPSGYADFLPELEKEVLGYGKPVLFLHGDTHYFRVDKPLFRSGVFGGGDRGRQIENFTRVEVHGFPESHWVRIAVDPREPVVFSFKEQIVEANRYQKR